MSVWRALCGKDRDSEGDEINGVDCVFCRTWSQSGCCLLSSSSLSDRANGAIRPSCPAWIRAERRKKGESVQSFHYDEVIAFLLGSPHGSLIINNSAEVSLKAVAHEAKASVGVWTCPLSALLPILALFRFFSTAVDHNLSLLIICIGLVGKLCVDIIMSVLRRS